MIHNRLGIIKGVDIAAAALVLAGGLNWGFFGFFGVDLIAALFGPASAFSRLFYALIGFAALYEVVQWRAIQRRWECRPWPGIAERAGA
jgi:hypothetical protein